MRVRFICMFLILALFGAVHAQQAIRPVGITPDVEKSISRGLAYLARCQAKDGAWRNGSRGARYTITMTSLAGIALMMGGNTPTQGKYAKNVAAAVNYLLANSKSNGMIMDTSDLGRPMYGHGFAVLFLAHAYGMESDPIRQKRIAGVLERGAMLISKAQSKAGGWYYTAGSPNDEGSVTVTQIQALRACRDSGLYVAPLTIKRACEYMHKCATKDGGICYSLRSRGRALPSITAAATATMYNAGDFEHPIAKRAIGYIKKLLVSKNYDFNQAFRGHMFYGLLYASQAAWFQGDKEWKIFFGNARRQLLRIQNGDGSWRGDSVGTVYGTSIGLMVLQLPYRRLPLLQR